MLGLKLNRVSKRGHRCWDGLHSSGKIQQYNKDQAVSYLPHPKRQATGMINNHPYVIDVIIVTCQTNVKYVSD